MTQDAKLLNQEQFQLITEIRDEFAQKSKQDLDKMNRLQQAADENEVKYSAIVSEQQKLQEMIKKQEAQLELMEKQAARLPAGQQQEQKKQEIKEFLDVVAKKGVGVEQKYYRTDYNPEGGYLAPPEYYNQIIEKVREISPMRQLAMTVTTSAGDLYVPISNNNSNAFWVGEAGAIGRAQATFEQKKIPLNKLAGQASITWESMNDSMFNMESYISEQFVMSMAQEEGLAFIKGDGVVKPSGFLYDPSVVLSTSTVSGSFTSDDLMTLPYSIKTPYTNNASFLFSREAMAIIRTFKSTSMYLWEAMAPGAPRTINGFPYYLAQDMDQVAANLRPVAFGDWRRAYMIVERPEMRVIRDEYTQAVNGIVAFTAHRRVGGNVVLGEAIAVLECNV